MAKKGTKETQLFNGHRRKIKLKGGVKVFLDAKDRKHSRLQIEMPVSNENVLGMPEFMSAAYTTMQKDSSAEDYTGFDTYMEGIAVCFYVTDKSKTKLLRLTGCELEKFHLSKAGIGDKAIVSLCFELDVLGHKELYDFMWDNHNSVTFVDFDYNQNDIPFKASADEDDEEEEDEINGQERRREEAAARGTTRDRASEARAGLAVV